jgi:hypothetical protein
MATKRKVVKVKQARRPKPVITAPFSEEALEKGRVYQNVHGERRKVVQTYFTSGQQRGRWLVWQHEPIQHHNFGLLKLPVRRDCNILSFLAWANRR